MTASVNSRSAIFQESLVLPFKLNALASRISWQHTHSVLTVVLFLRTQSIMLGFWFQKKSPRCFVKKVFLEISQNSQENSWARVPCLIKFFKKKTLAHVFYSEFCESSKSTFFIEHLPWMLLWFILVASIVVTWVSWFSRHKFKLEAEDFIFHILQRNFPNFGVKILAL